MDNIQLKQLAFANCHNDRLVITQIDDTLEIEHLTKQLDGSWDSTYRWIFPCENKNNPFTEFFNSLTYLSDE